MQMTMTLSWRWRPAKMREGVIMLGLNRRPDTPEPKPAGKSALAPPMSATSPLPAAASSAPGRTAVAPAPVVPAPQSAVAAPAAQAPLPSPAAETPGSKLFVGINIKLKGVEISNCDVLVVEGQVEATVSSKAMEIAEPGTLKGTATIDVAEIHGHFSGELTARTLLVVHGSGRVSGTIRYGKLIVAEGGEVNGDVRQLDAPAAVTAGLPEAQPDPRRSQSQAPLLALGEGDRRPERAAATGT
jgi:cytoskeletal protein CcmA (bactofilin family)